MKYTENALNLITAKSYKGIGRAWLIKNLISNDNIDSIVSKLNNKISEKTSLQEFIRLRKNFEVRLNERLNAYCDGIVGIGDDNFPQHRGNVNDSEKPVFLFYKGDLNLLNIKNRNVSVIGLLNPSEQISKREKNIIKDLVIKGSTIISGLALGCDTIAHEEALFRNGKTVAILPNSLNNIMPATNKELAYKIIEEGGLIVSEYDTDFKSKMELSSRYKERDRLQALFCDAIILAASYSRDSAEKWKIYGQKLDSGARLAMGFANDYNITQAVMYDESIDKNNPMFDLNRELINQINNITVIEKNKISEAVDQLVDTSIIKGNKNGRQGSLF